MKNAIKTIPEVLSKVASKFASKTAMFLNNGNKISYKDMMWDVAKTCRALKEQGVTKNSKVAIFMDNSPQCVESFLAVTRMGAIAILLNYNFNENQIKEILVQEKPDAIFISDYKLNLVLGIADSTILGIDDNRVLKQVSCKVTNSITDVAEKDNAVIAFDISENGNLIKSVYTQKSFVKLTTEKKKKQQSVSVNSIIETVKLFILPILKGVGIKASI